MTQPEFFCRQLEARIQIQQQCIPWGRIYAVWLGVFFGGALSLALLIWSLCTDAELVARLGFAGELAACLLLGVGANRFYQRNAWQYRRWDVACPACRRSLVFPHRWESEEIAQGQCPRCQQTLFEP